MVRDIAGETKKLHGTGTKNPEKCPFFWQNEVLIISELRYANSKILCPSLSAQSPVNRKIYGTFFYQSYPRLPFYSLHHFLIVPWYSEIPYEFYHDA